MRYLDIDKTIKALEEQNGNESTLLNCYNADWIVSFLEAQPTADVQKVRHGKWIKASCSEKDGDAHCSECNHWDWSDCKYCSECGAKMDE